MNSTTAGLNWYEDKMVSLTSISHPPSSIEEDLKRYPLKEYEEMIYKLYNLDEYNQILKSQGGVCKICGRVEKTNKDLAVDHCHITNKIRGLLCSSCNIGIGCFKENINTLKIAIKYLENHQEGKNKQSKIHRERCLVHRQARSDEKKAIRDELKKRVDE